MAMRRTECLPFWHAASHSTHQRQLGCTLLQSQPVLRSPPAPFAVRSPQCGRSPCDLANISAPSARLARNPSAGFANRSWAAATANDCFRPGAEVRTSTCPVQPTGTLRACRPQRPASAGSLLPPTKPDRRRLRSVGEPGRAGRNYRRTGDTLGRRCAKHRNRWNWQGSGRIDRSTRPDAIADIRLRGPRRTGRLLPDQRWRWRSRVRSAGRCFLDGVAQGHGRDY